MAPNLAQRFWLRWQSKAAATGRLTAHGALRALSFERLEDRLTPAAGALDLTFGTGGKVTTDFAASNDVPLPLRCKPTARSSWRDRPRRRRQQFRPGAVQRRRHPRHQLRQRRQGHHRLRRHQGRWPTAWRCRPTARSSWRDRQAAQSRLRPGAVQHRRHPGHQLRRRRQGHHRLRRRHDFGLALALQADGKIVVAGTARAASSAISPWRAITPTAPWTPASTTTARSPPTSAATMTGQRRGAQTDGKIVVAGSR